MIPKFRAWVKDDFWGDEVFRVSSINYVDEGLTVTTCDRELGCCDDEFYFTDVVLMQSTGLKDKNGVEIYEGDIVNLHWFYFDGGSESEQELYAKEILNYNGMMCFEWRDNYIPLALMDWHEESFEIIGNVYEHEELIEV